MSDDDWAGVLTAMFLVSVSVLTALYINQRAWDNRAACMDYCDPRPGMIRCAQIFVDGAPIPTNCVCECYDPKDRTPVYDL